MTTPVVMKIVWILDPESLAYADILGLSFPSYVTLSKSHCVYEPLFPSLQNENSIYFIALLWGLCEIMHAQGLPYIRYAKHVSSLHMWIQFIKKE